MSGVTMEKFRVKRHAQVDLEFEGEVLAELSARDSPDQLRWQALRILRTAAGQYVVEQLGMTEVPGERTMRHVWGPLDTPIEVRAKVTKRRRDGSTYLTNIALEALELASEIDPAFRDALTERI